MATVFRVQKTKDFTVMSNHHLKNKDLSLRSKGLLSFMLSLPEDWDYSLKGLATLNKEGIDAIRSAINAVQAEPEQGKSTQLNTNKSNTEISNTDLLNTYPINSTEPEENGEPVKPQQPERIGMDKILAYRQLIKQNIEYDILCQKLNGNIGILNEIVDIITETVCTTREYLTVASEERNAETVKSKLLKLNSEHIEYVIDCMKNNTTDVHDTRKYLLAALFNAPSTIDSYYTLKVNHDMYGGN